MWPDIERIPLVDRTLEASRYLPRTEQRLFASGYLGGLSPFEWHHLEPDLEWRQQVLSVCCWASLVALSSARDMLQRDLADLGLANAWRSARERSMLMNDPLLSVLHEMRNYEVHLEYREGEIRENEKVIALETGEEVHMVGIGYYFAHVDFQRLSELRNIDSGKSSVTEEMVRWFNRQSLAFPSAYILGLARDRFKVYVDEFIGGCDGLERHSE